MEQIKPPIARIVPRALTLHDDVRQDDYYWLRDKNSPEVIEYLQAENAYTEARMAPAESLREQIYNEILGRIQQTDLDVPARRGDYFYYVRTEEGKQYPIFCRKQSSLQAPEQVLLNGNELAAGKEYFALGSFAVSEDGTLLAYSVDYNGSEQYTVSVKNLITGELLPESIPNTSEGIIWANDNRTFFYVTFDATKRPEKVHRHIIGRGTELDEVVFTEPDPLFTFHLGKTRSRQFLLITSINASTTSEVLFLSAHQPEGNFQVFTPRRVGVEYYTEHQGDRFLVWTNQDGAINFKLMETPVKATALEHWHEVLPESPDSTLDHVDAFEHYLVFQTREHGLPCLRITDLRSGDSHKVEFPEPAYTVAPQANYEYGTSLFRFVYTSQVTPASVFDYDMATRERTLLKQTAVLGGYDPARYAAERIYAKAEDGKEIPISLVYKRGMERNGNNPLLLNGYGSYGINSDPVFSFSALSLLDRGFIVAIAHVRGGSEYGRRWFEGGRMLHKHNSFTDFVACAEHLVTEKYTSPDRLAAMGGSAGGLLMGAVINLRPDLFHTVVAHVPFVDVVTTMLDPTIPLTTGEYDQWGNPEEKRYYDYMKSYSPYDNVRRTAYPNLLVTTGLNDPRVAYWEPAKWVAKLRSLKTDNNLLLLKTQMGAGHGGPSGRYERFKETAFAYAFILMTIQAANRIP